MQKRRLIHGSISGGIYEITTKEKVRAEDFAKAMKRIVDEFFIGAVRISVTGESSGYTDISVSIIAELIQRMLRGLEPHDPLTINIELGEELRITLGARKLPEVKALAKVISLARSAGFTVTRDETNVFLTSKIEYTQMLSIYANSADAIYEELRYILISQT